ncbi:hypothetical protein [Mycobacterium antarcticum]|uniref:hypothetical protein n=1 Tax=unclassified Mycolicibacterium TaxID=2636767 RepID=UPI0024E0C244|nr:MULTISPECIES: hypothetical protein [unclassified Mycolicibacterium]
MNVYGVPFLGTEALAAGAVNKHQLRTRYRSVFPGVYVEPDLELTLQQRAKAAWLWSGREAVIAGLAASALHGAEWIDGQAPVELIWSNARPPQGIRTRRDRLAVGEVMSLTGMRVTTPVRTAFDLGRLIRGDEGIERLDALGQVARFSAADVEAVADRHRGSPGAPRLRRALEAYDPGAESPRETWLRLLLVRAGYPRPRTQIPVCDETGRPIYFLDMGWEDVKIAVEYDGDQHRERRRWGKDIVRSEYLAHRRWRHIRVVAGNRPADVLNRVRRAWAASVRGDREIA